MAPADALFEILTLNLIDTLVLGVHTPFARADVDVIFEGGLPLVERIQVDGVPSFDVPGDILRGMTAASSVAQKLNEVLVASDRGPLSKRISATREELGVCSIDVGDARIFSTDAELGREQSVNKIFMAAVAQQLRRGTDAQLRFQDDVTGGKGDAFEFQFDGPNERLHFAHGTRRTSRRGFWLGQYSHRHSAFRWIWDIDEAPEYVQRGASRLPDLAIAPGYGALRMGTFVAHPTFVVQALHVASEMLGGSTIYSFDLDPLTRAYFAVFED
jgi:hypothetical protein